MAEITPNDMLVYFEHGLVGYKEFRSYLSSVNPLFSEIRDPDVDNEIDRLARDRERFREQAEEELKAQIARNVSDSQEK